MDPSVKYRLVVKFIVLVINFNRCPASHAIFVLKPGHSGALTSIEMAFMNWKSLDRVIDRTAVTKESTESSGTF